MPTKCHHDRLNIKTYEQYVQVLFASLNSESFPSLSNDIRHRHKVPITLAK